MTKLRRAERRSDRQSLKLLLDGRYLNLFGLAFSSTIGALTEALFLVMVTKVAFAIADESTSGVSMAGLEFSVGQAIALMAFIVVVRVALAALSSWQSAVLSTTVTASIRRVLAESFLFASWERQHGERAGRLQQLLTGFTSRGTQLVTNLASGINSGCSLAAMLVAAVLIDPLASLIAIAVIFVLGLVLRPLRNAVRRQSTVTTRSTMQFATSLSEISQLGMEMHVFRVQDQAHEQVRELIDIDESTGRRLRIMQGLLPVIYGGMAYIAIVLSLAVIAGMDSTDIDSVSAAMLVMLRSLTYGKSMQTSSTEVTSALPFIEILRQEIDGYRESWPVDGGAPIGELGVISLEDVDFEYETESPVLTGINAEIRPCEVVGVIGPSGSGKSTLVQLLLGLRQPTSGVVRAAGRDINTLSQAEWSRLVTFVPQQAHLVAGTVADNIRFFREWVTLEDIRRAAELANLHEDVLRFEDGYEHQVGEAGSHLSGGQQQRLIIARALVEQPQLLILDEPTSALDVRSEVAIRHAIDGLRDRMTVIIIAHRLSTLDTCDRLMVIQDGELKGFDTPEGLEASSDFYREVLGLSGLR